MTHRALLATLLLTASGMAEVAAGRESSSCPSISESMIETVLSREGPSNTDAWTLAGCFWPEMTAALRETAPDTTKLDTALSDLVRHHVRHSLTSEKPALPDTASAARRLFSILLDSKPPAAGTVVALMTHSTLHDHAFHSLRERINDPDVVRELAAVLADPVRRNDAVTLLNLVRGRPAVAPLAEFLKHPDETVRGETVWLLARTGVRETLPLVKEALKDDSPTVRYNAVWGLSLFPRDRAAPLVRPVLHDSSPVVRRAAAAVEAQLVDPASLPLLFDLLRDPDASVRKESIYALAAIADPSSIRPLSEVLEKDTDRPARVMAAGALRHFQDENAVTALVKALNDPDEKVRSAAQHALVDLGAQTADHAHRRCARWKKQFDRSDENEKLAEIERIAAADGSTPSGCLTTLAVADLSPPLAALARAATAYRGEPGALLTLREDMKDSSFRAALIHFMNDARKPSLPFAWMALRSDDREIRATLAPLLVNFDNPFLIEPLLESLADPDLRVDARAALARWAKDPRHTAAFANALEHPEHGSWALEILWETHEVEVARELEKALTHPSPEVRARAAQILGNIGDSTTVQPLAEAAKDPVPLVRRPAVVALGNLKQLPAVPGLVEALKDPDAGVRYEAAWSIARILRERDGKPVTPEPHVVEALRQTLTDEVPTVRCAAEGAFMILKVPQVVPDLRERLKDPNAQVRMDALVALSEVQTAEATEAILSALHTQDDKLRLRAVILLGYRMNDAIRARMETMRASDPSPLVRQAAGEALK